MFVSSKAWLWRCGMCCAADHLRSSTHLRFKGFDSRAAAEESVAEYHEGYFMGNKTHVEVSHGGGRTTKYVREPGACLKCRQHDHWAR